MKNTIFLCLLLLVGCGGGGSDPGPPAQPLPVMLVQASDSLVSTAGYALSIYPTNESDPVRSVALQSAQPGQLMLWPGNTKRDGFGKFQSYVDAAVPNPAFKSVYVVDEWCWLHLRGFGDCRDSEIKAASQYARAHGLLAVASILPAAILHPAFKPADINIFDVIGIDIYPSQPGGNGDCAITGNPYTALLACSVERLRALGFRGQVWYITQAFGVTTEPLYQTLAGLALQRETIAAAPGLGISAVVHYGQYLSAADIENEPTLYQGRGSAIESVLDLR